MDNIRHEACGFCVENGVCLWQKRGEVDICPDVREYVDLIVKPRTMIHKPNCNCDRCWTGRSLARCAKLLKKCEAQIEAMKREEDANN